MNITKGVPRGHMKLEAACKKIGISRSQIDREIRELGIERGHGKDDGKRGIYTYLKKEDVEKIAEHMAKGRKTPRSMAVDIFTKIYTNSLLGRELREEDMKMLEDVKNGDKPTTTEILELIGKEIDDLNKAIDDEVQRRLDVARFEHDQKTMELRAEAREEKKKYKKFMKEKGAALAILFATEHLDNDKKKAIENILKKEV